MNKKLQIGIFIIVLYIAALATFFVLSARYEDQALVNKVEQKSNYVPKQMEHPVPSVTTLPTVISRIKDNQTNNAISLINKGQPQITQEYLIFSGKIINATAPFEMTFREGIYNVDVDSEGSWTAKVPREKIRLLKQKVTFSVDLSTKEAPYNTVREYVDIDIPPLSGTDIKTPITVVWNPDGPALPDTSKFINNDLKELLSGLTYYHVGKVINYGISKFHDFDVYVATDICYGLCYGGYNAYFLINSRGTVGYNIVMQGVPVTQLFDIYSGIGNKLYGSLNTTGPIIDDNHVYIENLDNQKDQQLADSDYKIIYTGDIDDTTHMLNFNETELVGKTKDGKDVYYDDGSGYLYIPRLDGTFAKYKYEIPFMIEGKIPDIMWSDGTRNKSDYGIGEVSGCGSTKYLAVRPEYDVLSEEFEVVGETINGENIYALSNKNDKRLTEMHRLFGWSGYGSDRKAISYRDFLKDRPLVYWVSPHNMVIEMRKASYRPLAECGKPVIYLYPENKTKVHVSVGLKGEMTVSEPEHGLRGWDIIADSGGYVTNISDGKKYPYLYWEGYGVDYPIPKEGFVVAQKDIAIWLPKTLDEIGFTSRERDEFLEFWLPRLPKSPYIFITFIDQSYFDRNAPLMITPKPDTITRVFMEYRPVYKKINVPTQMLPHIKREGFTVVEWGGAIY